MWAQLGMYLVLQMFLYVMEFMLDMSELLQFSRDLATILRVDPVKSLNPDWQLNT